MNRGDQINSDELLYRRGFNSPEKKYLNPDGTATSRVFKLRPKDNEKLSVDLTRLTTPEKSVVDPSQFNLFEIKNTTVEEIGLHTVYDAVFTSENNSHCLIMGMSNDDETKPSYLAKKSKKIYPY
jgi:hypothetical protein